MIKDMSLVVFVSSLLSSFVMLNLILVLSRIKNFYRNKRFLIVTILLGIYISLSYMITDNFIRTVLVFVLLILFTLYIQDDKKKNIFSVTLIAFFVWLTVMLVDIFCTIISKIIFNPEILIMIKNNFQSRNFNYD